MKERRRAPACTCGAQGATYYDDPHKPGCPRYRDRSKSEHVLAALRRRYGDADGEWLFYAEVWRIDAFALRCWQAGIGNRRMAFEVKTSRPDFLAEIRNPQKRQNALDISHVYYFATPKGLVDRTEIPPECGLIEVDEKGQTRITVRAPVRAARGLKMSEAIYLMRQPLYKGGILQLRREVLLTENLAEHHREMEVAARRERDRARELLERHAGHLIVKGSMWKGVWSPHSWVKATEPVEVYVADVIERVYEDGVYSAVEVRRLDAPDAFPWRFHSRGEFLGHFEPLDAQPLIVLGAAHV